jgi:hypothetical protein
MNPTSPVATGSAAITGAMLGGIIDWLCTVAHVAPPPDGISAAIGAVILTGAHYGVNWLNRRFPAAPAQSGAPANPPAAT